MDNRHDNYKYIPAVLLKKAILSMEDLLGVTAAEALLEDLEQHGMLFEGRRTYGIQDVEPIIENTFGTVTPLLIGQLIKHLNSDNSITV